MSAAVGALGFANVLYEKKGAVAHVTLNRPKAFLEKRPPQFQGR